MNFEDSTTSIELSVEEREIFLGLLEEEGVTFTHVQMIPRRANSGELPLSFAQQRLWFLDQLAPGNASYNFPVAVRLQGRLDIAALERSLNEVVNRHEVLRTTFPAVDGQPVQSIAPALSLTMPVIDLREFPRDMQEAQARLLAAEEAQRPFDLAEGPLLRATLLRLGDEDYVALLTMSHIVSDGWSMGVLVKEVGALYEAYSQGKESPLEELPIQYADYAAWQREWLSGEVLETQLAYWKERLAGAPPALELPTDHARPAIQTYRGATESLRLPATLADSLRELSRREDVTLFMTLLAAFQTLLMRYTGQRDVVVGSPIANRNRAEIEELIGFFVNTLALRTDLCGDPPFVELIGRVREVALGAYAHQDLPFERLVGEIQPERDLGRHPLFQVMMVLQNAPREAMELPGLRLSVQPSESGTTKFDLTLSLVETEGGLVGSLEYSTDLFEVETIRRMLGHYQRLLESVVADPQRRLSELELLAEAEREQLLVEWNRTRSDYPSEQSIHELFERQVELAPDRTAVAFEEEQLSYAELSGRANRLAHYLRGLGVGPDTRVGVLMERSVEMVVGVLGVLKAGGAYVPLDPAYPEERLAFMVKDAEALALLTQRRLVKELGECECQAVWLDEEWDEIAKEGEENPASGVRSANLAYVIYTSGSTGQPKGVQVPHAAVVNFLASMQAHPGITVEDNLLSVTSLSFDISILEIILPLTVGARLVVAHRDTTLIGERLSDAAAKSQATVIQATPTTYQLLIDSGWEGSSGLKILCGGEAMSPKLAGRLLERCGSLWNLYGPTETTIWSTLCEVHPESKTPSIGHPIKNTQCYILDGNLAPTPIGAVGSLYIGGAGLARGYRNLPAITADRFIPDSFSREPGARLYRTGDLARYQSDGSIEFLGRGDFQVKLRGFRIELEEIEALLNQHYSIKQAIVTVVGDDINTLGLAAYVVFDGSELTISELRQYLREKLPEYMVPAAWVVLESLPLTPNGKVNRRALPVPTRTQVEGAGIAARTPTEEMLVGIWREALRLEQVGIDDNFFELGGHSLLATQLISRVRKAFAIELPLRALFENPTVMGLARCVDAEMRAGRQSISAPPIAPVVRNGRLPMSFAQQRLWFLDQLAPGASFYNIPAAVRLQGRLDVAAFERSLNEVVRRHEALRTRFVSEEGQPAQSIVPPLPLALPVIDLQEFPQEAREARARLMAAEEAQRPFDLAEGPLLRATLLRLGEEDHVALLTMSHIVSDGWSIGVLMREVAALYEAYSQGRQSPLEELPIQYADYAAWQREWLSGEALETQLAYWKRQLACLPALNLPTDHPRPDAQSYLGASQVVALPQPLTEQLKALSQRQGVTLFMTLLAAFQTLLMRYTGQRDVVVGSPIANRGRAEIEGLIGFFVNTLVMRTDLGGDPPFVELLWRVREVALGAYAHQDLPFERLVEELQPERDLSRHPLFQVMMVLQNAPREAVELPGLRLSTLPSESGTTKFDLTLSLAEGEGGLTGSLEYSTDLFEAETIRRMLGHYQRLLESVVADPHLRLSELELLAEAEREQLLVEWNRTRSDYPREQSIHELFERQVGLAPEQTAVVFEEEQLSYEELNWRANRIANYLRRLGVRPDTRVGVLMERSVEMVVGMLGVLKAGGAYAPLDPAYPEERLAFMIEEAKVQVMLTQERLLRVLPECQCQAVCLDKEWEEIAKQSDENPVNVAGPDNLAYVIYTSGSTGRPKGVAVTHRNVARLVKETNYARFDPDEVFLQMAPITFDASTFELWGCLLNGARLVVFPPHKPSLAELGQALRRHGVTTLWLTAGLFHQMADDHLESLRGVRQLLAGGDVLSFRHVERVAGELKGCQLINGYGPTESATFACCHPVTPSNGKIGQSVPIGRPIANTSVYVLNGQSQPAPVGAAGELHIGGDGLARGYLERPDLTAERFIPHLFSKEPGERLYRTGDLARYLPDGNLEFLGRLDGQVKLRGYRIELGEIEAALREHPRVREAVALARQDSPGEKRLVAYVLCDPEIAAAITELRSHLKRRLPDYMAPSAFMLLDKLPLTPNGKVDRRALPAPDQDRPDVDAAYVAPRTPAEEVIAGIWSQVLGVERVGVYDNFFELGGHSLLATQVISRVRGAFQVEAALRSLFEGPTVAELAQGVEAGLRAGAGMQTPAIRRVSRERGTPLSFAQQRLWFLDQLMPESSFYNIPAAIRLQGRLDIEAFKRSLNEVVSRHEALRTRFVSEDGQAAQSIAPTLPLALPVIDLQGFPQETLEARARLMAAEEAQRPFDLAEGPLLRATLLRLGEEDHVALLTMHHIVSDGWSIGVLVREVAALYEAYSQEGPSPLEELPIQYADYAAWQREWLSGEALKTQLAYWKRQLACLPALNLPTDHSRHVVQSHRGASQAVALPQPLTERLKALSQQQGVTLFMTLLAAFQTLLMRYTGQRDIVVGSPIANRGRAEIEGLIGFFVNTLVMRTDLRGDPPFVELLGRVREVALGAYAHQDLPFERLVEELQPERDLSRHPLFQVMMVLQNAPREAVELPGLRLSTLPSESGTTKFDLTLSLAEGEGGLTGSLEYSTDLFEAETIRRMLGHYQRLLESVVADSHLRLSELELLAEAEREQLLVEWNRTRSDYPREQSIHELFERQVGLAPDRTAVAFGDEQLSYEELNWRANRIANYLRRLGVGLDTRVGILMERSVEMVMGVLGVLKAGGAYVPLDPAYPEERLAFMMKDAEARVVLTQERLLVGSPGYQGRVVCLDAEWEEIAKESDENPISGVLADNLAYVIYTSGSTGRPKGVSLPQRALTNLLHWHQAALPGAARMLQFASLSFDASFHEMFAAWGAGATLVLISETARLDVKELGCYLASASIEKVTLPVVMLQHLAQESEDGEELSSSLKDIIATGEQLQITRPIVDLFRQRQEIALHNHYGPSETHLATTMTLTDPPELWPVYPSIGKPISNFQMYVLDPVMNPTPIGIAGELYIGGEGLARGYLERPDLTAERFIPHLFSKEPGERLYRTGDLVRYLPDGNLEFLGRLDDQVKLRGYRIELGEIEAALREHPRVREAVVLARQDSPGDKRLVAYIVPEREQAPTVSETRAFLKERLPEYMVPSAFVLLDELPLSPNGKVNRRALPALDHTRPEVEAAYVSPRTMVEEVIAAIWSQVLGVEKVGVYDNFFELGGHSLLATRVISRVRSAFQTNTLLRRLFESPTVAGLAEIVEKEAGFTDGSQALPVLSISRTGHSPLLTDQHYPIEPSEVAALEKYPGILEAVVRTWEENSAGSPPERREYSPLLPLQPHGSKRPFFFVHPGSGSSGCYFHLANYLDGDRPFYGLQARGLDGREDPHNRVEDMAAEYIDALLDVQQTGPYLLGGWSSGGLITFEMAQQLRKRGHSVSLLALLDTVLPSGGGNLKTDDATILMDLFPELRPFISPDSFQRLSLDEKIALVMQRFRINNWIPPGFGLSWFRGFYNVYKAYYLASESYSPQFYPGRITLFRPNEQIAKDLSNMDLGWGGLAAAVDIHVVPGTHTDMISESRVVGLAETLKVCALRAD
jgi:amino acid adenylation domain-containing protein